MFELLGYYHSYGYLSMMYAYTMWFQLTLLGVLAYSGYYLLSRVFLKQKNSDAVAYAIVFNIICATIISVVALSRGFTLPDLKKYAFNLILMGILYTLSQVFIFQASKTIEASELIIISSTRVLWTIGGGLLFLGESFDLAKALGTALILFSVVFVSYKKKQMRFSKGHVYALLAGVCLGVGFVNDSYILRQTDAVSYAAVAFILPAFLTIIIFPRAALQLKKFITYKTLRNTFLLGLFYSVGIIASYAAYTAGGTASQIVPIGQSVVIVTVILGALFLKERDNLWKKAIASVLVAIGVLLLR